MQQLVGLLQEDADFRLRYVFGGFVLMIVPMLVLALWYHRRILRTPGGRLLMQRQNASRPRAKGSLLMAYGQFADGMRLAGEIAAGRYGRDAKRMQNVVYWVTGIWVTVLVIYFGVLLWADEAARTAVP